MLSSSLLRSTFCTLRRHVNLFKDPPSIFLGAKSTNVYYVAKCSSGNPNITAYQQSSIATKREKSKEIEDGISQEFEEMFSFEQKEYMLPSKRRKAHADLLMRKISTCQSANDVLELYGKYGNVMNQMHLLRTLRILNTLATKRKVDCEALHDSNEFQDICQRLLKLSRQMEAVDLLSILTNLCRLEVNVNTEIVRIVLQLLKHSITDLELNELIHLEFLLKKMKTVPISQAMLIAIPLVLDSKVTKATVESLSIKQLSEALAIGVREGIRSLDVLLQEVYERGAISSGKDALTILWTLLDLHIKMKNVHLNKEGTLISEILIKECIKVVSRNLESYSFIQIKTILKKMGKAYKNSDSACYSEQLCNAIAVHCIDNKVDFEGTSFILSKLFKVNFVSEDLTRYMMKSLQENQDCIPDTYLFSPILFTAIAAFPSPTTECTKMVELLLSHKSLTLDQEFCLRLPVMHVLLDLLSIGYYHYPMLELFTNAEFLSQYIEKFHKNYGTCRDLLQLNQVLSLEGKSSLRVPDEFLKECVNYSFNNNPETTELAVRLRKIFINPDCVVSGVLTDDDLFIDHLIAMDENGIPQEIGGEEYAKGFTRIADLDIPESCKKIAVLDIKPREVHRPKHELRRYMRVHEKLLVASGFSVAPVKQLLLNRLTVDEKNFYIRNIIDQC